MDLPTLQVKRLCPYAKLPVYATEGAACFDISAAFDEWIEGSSHITILPRQSAIIPTGLSFEIPRGYAVLLYSRSGHAFKHNIRLSNCVGVIDSDYRGEVKASIYNDGHTIFTVEPGERILQGFLVPAPQANIEEVKEVSETRRGEGGFGSTGK